MKKTHILGFIVFLLFGVEVVFTQDYLVGTGDVLRITVYDNEDLNTTVRVSGEGSVVLPLIKRVEVKGLSISEITEKLVTLYADGYLKNPQVNIFVEEYRGQKVVILGQINRPGLYELQGTTTLLELISKAGGMTNDAGESAVIKRKSDTQGLDKQIEIMINMKALIEEGDISKNISIRDGDNIYISKVGLFYVTGAVTRPDGYRYQKNLTVLKAITLAGGFTGRAGKDKIKIQRTIGSETTTLDNVNPNELVLENDIIVVPESFF